MEVYRGGMVGAERRGFAARAAAPFAALVLLCLEVLSACVLVVVENRPPWGIPTWEVVRALNARAALLTVSC